MRAFRFAMLLLIAASMNYVIGFAIAKWAPLTSGPAPIIYPLADGGTLLGAPKTDAAWPVEPPDSFNLISAQLPLQYASDDPWGTEYKQLSSPLGEKKLLFPGMAMRILSGQIRLSSKGYCDVTFDSFSMETVHVGLPFKSLTGNVHSSGDAILRNTVYYTSALRHGVELEPPCDIAIPWDDEVFAAQSRGTLTRIFPLRAVPTGFIANTSIYFAILLLATRGISTIAQRWRGRSGHCRSCGYDVAGLDTCPECGREVELNRIAVG